MQCLFWGSKCGGNNRLILAENIVLLSFNTVFPYNNVGVGDLGAKMWEGIPLPPHNPPHRGDNKHC